MTGIKILVVEDNEDSRSLLTFLLEQENASVTATASASEALSALSQSLPDVLISDISMPEVDGYTLIRQIRELPSRGGQIPAIAMTAYAEESDRAAAISAGFQRHITKPVNVDDLIEAISSLVVRGSNS
ncbi:response regulator [Pleurocapsales cyanobacterium LEGE 10410]|nr:response regulator [Pleurocapsales cyanobacterium LEGE 10410]